MRSVRLIAPGTGLRGDTQVCPIEAGQGDHVAQALGHLAVRQGAPVRFAKTGRILADLAGGHADRTWDNRIRELVRPDVLILHDDCARRQLGASQADDLYELVSERQNRPLIITSNRAPGRHRGEPKGKAFLPESALCPVVAASGVWEFGQLPITAQHCQRVFVLGSRVVEPDAPRRWQGVLDPLLSHAGAVGGRDQSLAGPDAPHPACTATSGWPPWKRSASASSVTASPACSATSRRLLPARATS
ncbi:hypothetical protein QFZ76_009583 [Streptomyces sp. V4I2]|nr:hypothetical protein [Streptomyces sp. V4I2]